MQTSEMATSHDVASNWVRRSFDDVRAAVVVKYGRYTRYDAEDETVVLVDQALEMVESSCQLSGSAMSADKFLMLWGWGLWGLCRE